MRRPWTPHRSEQRSRRLALGHARKAKREIEDQERRSGVARALAEGKTIGQVARENHTSAEKAREAMSQSLERLRNEDAWEKAERGGRQGEVLDPPDEVAFKQQAYDLRKRALPFDKIAELTGRTEAECRKAVRDKLRRMELDELHDTALAKQMMLEQIDAMIAAIFVPATGQTIDGRPALVDLGAIDRMVKLMNKKSELLGLDAPRRIDITHRLEQIAAENGYDVEEVRSIAAEVLSKEYGELP